LVLHALGTDARIPERNVVRASALLRAREKVWLGGEELLSWRGFAWLMGRVSSPPPPGRRPSSTVGDHKAGPRGLGEIAAALDQLAKGQNDEPRAGVEDCLGLLDLADQPPGLLTAAVFLEAWRIVDPMPSYRGLGSIFAAQVLRIGQRFSAGLFPFEVALRRRPMPPRLAWAPVLDRLAFWFETFDLAASLELEELHRLALQKVQLERRASGGRRHGKAAALAALAVDHSVLTTEIISRALGVTPQASGQLIKRFDGVLREITGRSRYRVWGL
jgi:hypothetical protein